jgi:hypothetical protein
MPADPPKFVPGDQVVAWGDVYTVTNVSPLRFDGADIKTWIYEVRYGLAGARRSIAEYHLSYRNPLETLSEI